MKIIMKISQYTICYTIYNIDMLLQVCVDNNVLVRGKTRPSSEASGRQ